MKKSFSVLFTTILISIIIANKNIKTNVVSCKSNIDKFFQVDSELGIEKLALNEGSTSLAYCPLGTYTIFDVVYNDENKIHCKFSHIQEKGKIEDIKKRKFAVLIDSVKGPIDYKFLEKEEIFSVCDFILPENSNYLNIHIYGQDENDPDFLLREENFLCKAKFWSRDSTFLFDRKYENCVEYYDENGNSYQETRLDLYKMLLPGFFAVKSLNRIDEENMTQVVAVLDLPNGKNDEVQYEDRVFSFMRLNGEYGDSSIGEVMPTYEYFLIFDIPEDVDNFSLKLYSVSPHKGYGGDVNYRGEYKVRLNRS